MPMHSPLPGDFSHLDPELLRSATTGQPTYSQRMAQYGEQMRSASTTLAALVREGGGATFVHNPGYKGQVMDVHWDKHDDPHGPQNPSVKPLVAVGGHLDPRTGKRHPTAIINDKQFGAESVLQELYRTASIHGEGGEVGTGFWGEREEGETEFKKGIEADVATVMPGETHAQRTTALRVGEARGEDATFASNPGHEEFTPGAMYDKQVHRYGGRPGATSITVKPPGYAKWKRKRTKARAGRPWGFG